MFHNDQRDSLKDLENTHPMHQQSNSHKHRCISGSTCVGANRTRTSAPLVIGAQLRSTARWLKQANNDPFRLLSQTPNATVLRHRAKAVVSSIIAIGRTSHRHEIINVQLIDLARMIKCNYIIIGSRGHHEENCLFELHLRDILKLIFQRFDHSAVRFSIRSLCHFVMLLLQNSSRYLPLTNLVLFLLTRASMTSSSLFLTFNKSFFVVRCYFMHYLH